MLATTEEKWQSLGHIMTLCACLPIILYCLLLFADSTKVNKSIKVGLLSIVAAYVQLTGYGCGFISSWWKRCVKGQDEFSAYKKTFYK